MDLLAAGALHEHRERAVEVAQACGVSLSKDAFVFSPEPDGARPFRPDWPTKAFRRARERAVEEDLPAMVQVRLYDVRHFMATQLIGAGTPLPTVAARMGNSPRTLLLAYAHAIPAADHDAAETMGRIMGGQPKHSSPRDIALDGQPVD